MIIKSLEIKNFRSFDETCSPIKFSDGVNIVVGENNVGKSNILKSLELLIGRKLSSEDYYKGETDRENRITTVIELNEEEMKHFVSHLVQKQSPSQVRRFLSELENTFELEYSSKAGGLIVRFHDFSISSHLLFLSSDFGSRSYEQVNWDQTRERYLQQKKPLPEFIRRELTTSELKKKCLYFAFEIPDVIRRMFNQKVKCFVETRQCPSGTNKDVLESYDGTLVADVLSNLKNGNRVQRSKWRRIKREFHDLFPSLELEVTKPAGKPPKIMIAKEAIKYEVPVSFVGAGIWEIVILLTHLFSFENMCFGIDMPELHFHHHTIRLLRNLLRGKSGSNQFLIVTHSPLFIEPAKLENVLVVREREGRTVVKQLDIDLDSYERERLRRHLEEHAREFFFSRAVLIVEGPTEKGAMPIFSRLLKKDFDKHGISVIEAGSQFCRIFIRILEAFDFPYLVMHDNDALMDISQSIERDGTSIKTSAVFYNLEQLLEQDDFETIEKMESRIQSTGGRRQKEIYPDDCFTELRDLALKYDIYVLPTDFEGILKRDGYEKFLRTLDFCDKSLGAANAIKNAIMEDVRREIEERTKEQFFNLIWKKETYIDVKIDDAYNISVLHQSGMEGIGTLSAGERQVLALSFMAALNSVSGFDVPIIIDTPLGRISREPKKSIARNLPNYLKGKQVTLLVTEEEYTPEVRGLLSDRVGKNYVIEFKETGYGNLAEVIPL